MSTAIYALYLEALRVQQRWGERMADWGQEWPSGGLRWSTPPLQPSAAETPPSMHPAHHLALHDQICTSAATTSQDVGQARQAVAEPMPPGGAGPYV